MTIKFFDEINKSSIKETGGKGASLGEMTQAGLPVPPGFVITTQTYQEFSTQELPVDVKEEILSAFDQLGSDRVAVRSSAVAEDSSAASWAGQLETYLNVSREGLLDKIRDCWNSIRSERALAYADQQNIPESELLVAVVVQKMIESEVSGVMFSVNPINKNHDEIMIESGYGLGEYIVQGTITPDNFVISKAELEIKSKDIQKQEVMYAYKDGQNQEVSVPEEKQRESSLSEEQVKELSRLAIKIEDHYGNPQDMEWAFEDGKFYIVQSRPITTLDIKEDQEELEISGAALLEGLPASPGIKTGPARVIQSLEELSQVQESEILIARKTTPDFVEAFGKVIAIVTDEGGITSHAAIVSRELGIPAVVGTKQATTLIKNGQILTIDGHTGKVYEGKISLKAALATGTSTITPPEYTGDDIEDMITSIVRSINDSTELWPLKPGQIMPYYDSDQAVDMYHKLEQLIKSGKSFDEIASLFEHPNHLRIFMLDAGIIGFKAARVLNLFPVNLEDQLKFTEWIIKLLRVFTPDDPVCLKGTNFVWSRDQVDRFIDKARWVELDDPLRKGINLLWVNLISYVWGFYWDYFPDTAVEVYGPYRVNSPKLGEDKILLIKDHFNLKAPEVWPISNKLPFNSLILSQSYNKEDIYLNFGNRIGNKESLSSFNHYFNLKVDGREVTDLDEILKIANELAKVTQEQVEYVNSLSDIDKVKKGTELAYYALRNFYQQFDENWYPKERIEKSLEILGDQFLVKSKEEKNRSVEQKRISFDPRNENW